MAAARGAEAPAQAAPAQAGQASTNAPPAKADETATNAAPAKAGEAAAALTPEQMFEGEAAYKNWVEFSTGGFIVRGDAGQAEQREQLKRGAFGGIQDLHVEGNLDKKTTVTVDGHSIFDDHDYQLNLALKREDTGYVRVGFENFRTWSDSAGGFFPPDNLQFSQEGEGLGVDRGQVFLEAGLNLKNAPKVTIRYTHRYRDGDKSSTLWGPVNTSQGTRNIFPGSYDLDETFDTFGLDVTHRIKTVDFGAGIRYETTSLNDGLLTTSQPDATFQQRIADRQGTDYDMFTVHAFAESWLKKDLLLSAGFLYDNVDNTFSGDRIYGDDFNVAFAPNALSGLGYFDLHGGSRLHDYVFNLNALALPASHLTIVPSVRVEKMDSDADSEGTGTLGSFPTERFSARGDQDELDVTERVDFRYTGITNWVFYAGPELTEGRGNLKENGGLSQIAGIGVPPVHLSTDEARLFQKYFAGVRWYPTRRLSFDAGGYYKSHEYDYNNIVDSTPNTASSFNRYPGCLVLQNFDTYDGNVRATWRPVQNVTLVGRYEYQLSYVHTGPDPVSGLSETESATMTSHIIGLNAGWVPWNRLSLQLGLDYVLSDTRTPASDFTAAVLKAQNDYWTLSFNTGLVLDDKTDLNLGFFYYQPDNFVDNSTAGLPVGAAVQEYGLTALLTHKISKNIRLNLRYAFTHFQDYASGGFNNYEAHLLFSSIQYRF